jgi:hypothetical protein
MPTPFVSTTLVVLTVMNNAGQLTPIPRGDLPPPYTQEIMVSVEFCMLVRGRLAHPEGAVCQVFRSPSEANWTFRKGDSFTGDPVADVPLVEKRSENGPTGSATAQSGEASEAVATANTASAQVIYPVFYQMEQGYAGMATPASRQYGQNSFLVRRTARWR